MLKIFIVLLLSIFLFTGCGVNKNQEVIDFYSWGSISEVKILKQIISDFERENKNIKINFVHVPQNYFQKIHLLFASNTPPDVLFINNLYLPIYASKLANLSMFIDKEEYYLQSISGLSYEGKILAFPRDISNLVLYVNLDMTGNIPCDWTIEDFLKIAQNSTKDKKWGVSFEEDFYYVLPFLSYFGESFGEEFTYKKSKGFNFYKDLRDRYKVAPRKSQVGSSTLAQMFLDEKIAMYISGRWMYPKIKEKAKFNWKVYSLPIGVNPLSCDCSGWAISKDSKHKKIAIEFARYLSSQKSADFFVQTGLIVPARKKASFYINNTEYGEKTFIEIINKSQNTNVIKNYKRLIDKINLVLQE